MPLWPDEYLSALRGRDHIEKANESIYNSYTKLADKTASLQAKYLDHSSFTASSPQPSSTPSDRKPSRASQPPTYSPSPNDILTKLRQDLAEAQRSRGFLTNELRSITEELGKLKINFDINKKHINELSKEKTTLVRALGDRDEEIKGKAKLLEDLHDETVSLTLQLNMADERSTKLERENGDLVERWMKRMEREADEMNERSKFS